MEINDKVVKHARLDFKLQRQLLKIFCCVFGFLICILLLYGNWILSSTMIMTTITFMGTLLLKIHTYKKVMVKNEERHEEFKQQQKILKRNW